jgi:membrane protein required for colicin V production
MSLPALGWVDWALAAVLAVSIAVGLWRGLVFEVLSLLGWVAAYVAAQAFASSAAPMLPIGAPGSGLNQGAAFALVFMFALLAWALASRLLRLVIHATPLQLVDRVLGGGFGLLRGAVLLLAVATVVSLTPIARSPAWQQSQGAVWLGALLHGLKPVLPESLAQHLPT